jgi:hypothetical protein
MPEISHFLGIIIRMHFNDQAPPHFHAEYGGEDAVIEIGTLAVRRGRLPRRVFALVVEWAILHCEALSADWERARQGLPLEKIEPLD